MSRAGQEGRRRALAIPEAWAREIAERAEPLLFADEETVDVDLRLAIRPQLHSKVIQMGIDWATVAQDLNSGVRFERIQRPGADPYYILIAREHKVFLQAGQGWDTGVTMAVVTSVKLNQGLRQRSGLFPITARFQDISDEPDCDLEAAHQVWTTQAAAKARREDALQRARALLSEPGLPVTDPGDELHAATRRSHGALRTLIALLQERARRDGTRLIDATVVETPPTGDDETSPTGLLRIKLDDPRGLTERDVAEMITGDGESSGPSGKVVELSGDGEALLSFAALDQAPPCGTRVRLKRLPRPHLRAHRFALEDFFAERVQGRWLDLARLLVRPQDLSGFDPHPPLFWFCDQGAADRPLNDDQRQAVIGALSTPHVFFVQGPPGTGKTTVIVELIRQLAARGERVLMLAPTHVAVDEVLERVQGCPEIWPLRMSWDEGKVRPAVRPFVQRTAASSLAGKLRRPDVARARRAPRDAEADELAERDELLALERLWFEISGLGAEHSQEAQDEIASEIGDELIRAANLVCATTAGIAGAPLVRNVDFDTLIVDEASRVIDTEFLIGAVRARRWVLVGDEHQLPPHVEPKDEHYLHALHAIHLSRTREGCSLELAVETLGSLWSEEEELHRFRHKEVLARAQVLTEEPGLDADLQKLGEALETLRDLPEPHRAMLQLFRDQMVRSLFERAVAVCSPGIRRRLVVQRRMIPRLARLVAAPVYGGEYRSPAEDELARVGVRPLTTTTFHEPLVFLDTAAQGKRARDTLVGSGFINDLERRWIVRACQILDQELTERSIVNVTVSVLAFYRQQALALRRELGYPACEGFQSLRFQVIDAIDKIQGQESDIVLVSFCRRWHRPDQRPSSGYGLWLQDTRRLNVAFTRAHRALILVGHSPTLAGLSGAPEAERFYRNLQAELEAGAALILKDLR